MEDGIERSTLNYYCKNNSTKKEYKEHKEDTEIKYVYIFLHVNGNYIIFFDKEKAIDYSQKNSCRVDIFIETENSVYNSTKNYYKNGCLEIFSN
jgi:hypothetical protein